MQKNPNAEILVLDEKGTNLGKMQYRDAQSLALSRNLDLVQVNKDNKGIVVYKIMDYGKHKYDKKKNKQKIISHPLKEMNFKIRIDPHDMDIKINRIKGFLSKGSEVKITVAMRGRERAAPQLAKEKLDFILAELKNVIQNASPGKPTKSSICAIVRPLSKKSEKHANIKANSHARRSDEGDNRVNEEVRSSDGS